MILKLKIGVTREGAEALRARLEASGGEATVEQAGEGWVLRVSGPSEVAVAAAGAPETERVLSYHPEGSGLDAGAGTPVFPDHLLRQGVAVLLLLAVLVLLAGFLAPGLADRADPMTPPDPVRPAWYFAGFHVLVKMFPAGWESLGALLGLAFLAVFLVFPALDRGPLRSLARRRAAWAALLGGVLWIGLTVLGVFF